MKRYIKKEELQVVKTLDLLTYMQNYEPEELVRISRNVYGTKTHSSLQISNGMWNWFAKGIGGKSALDYLIKVKKMDFLDAAIYLRELIKGSPPLMIDSGNTSKVKHDLKLPTPCRSNDNIIQYLCVERSIDRDIVDFCIRHLDIYESAKDHAVIFVGYDQWSIPKYAMKRSTTTNEKRDIAGSNKRHSFMLKPKEDSKEVHVFEGAIDLLSYCSLQKMEGKEWRKDYLLSLGGVGRKGKDIKESTLSLALEEFLKKYNVDTVKLHLDNDLAGKQTTEIIQHHLEDDYKVTDCSLKQHVDLNDYLCSKTKKRSDKYVR